MMKLLVTFAVLCHCGHVLGAPVYNNNMMTSPAMRAIMDMIHKLLNQKAFSSPPKLMKPLPPPPIPAFTPPQPPVRPMPPAANSNGLFMDMPGGMNGGYGMNGGFGMNYVYCPPGPTSSDSCKEQKLNEALYFPSGAPRYDWVPQRNPYDSSISDSVKDTARNILLMKVNTRRNGTMDSRSPRYGRQGRNRMMSPKEREILSYL